jgi:FkbM family methyltransferase
MQQIRNKLVYGLHKMGIYGALDRGRDYLELTKGTRRQKFSQFGEDLFLREYFGNRTGLYIDVGGNHPFGMSNTYLLYRLGWSGIVVEPIRRLYTKHKRFRPRDIQVNAAAGESTGSLIFYEVIPACLSSCNTGEAKNLLSKERALLLREYPVPVVTVADLYQKYLAPRPISLLSIDTEGNDIAVLRGIDWVVMRPEVVICEANDDASGSEIRHFLTEYGYECLKVLGVNLVFRFTDIRSLS